MRYATDKQARTALLTQVNPHESSFCAVIATAQATDCSITKAYYTAKKYGRKDNDGMILERHIAAVSSLGYDCEMIHHVTTDGRATVNQIIKKLDKEETYLIYIANSRTAHVMTYREGQIRDWHAETHAGKAIRKGVHSVWRVIKQD